MGVDRRRAGFRLPWTADDERNGAEASAISAEEAASAEAQTLPAAEADVKADTATAAETTATPDAAPTAETDGDAPSTANATQVAEATEATAPAAPAAPAAPDAEAESSEFLQSLVGAMRGVAQTSRDASLSDLRTEIDARIEALATQSAERENDLRRRSELDLQSVGEWERTEVERIKAEAERKREARRAQLEQQLAEHRTTSEREVEATRNRLAEHERNLAEFFAQLSEISDPAAFVAAAKRMPRPQDASHDEAAVAVPTAEDPRLAALGMSPGAPAPAPAEIADEAQPGTEATADTSNTSADADTSDATGTPDAADVPDATPAPEATAEDGGIPESRLAERLAQLDQRISRGTEPVAAAAPTSAGSNGGETSTPIVVKGLGSFGAITSFKQALERVEGVRGVTLSLGPTGEFVYRASHAGEFDLVTAIQGIEGPTATIEDTEGTLVVTLSRAR